MHFHFCLLTQMEKYIKNLDSFIHRVMGTQAPNKYDDFALALLSLFDVCSCSTHTRDSASVEKVIMHVPWTVAEFHFSEVSFCKPKLSHI